MLQIIYAVVLCTRGMDSVVGVMGGGFYFLEDDGMGIGMWLTVCRVWSRILGGLGLV